MDFQEFLDYLNSNTLLGIPLVNLLSLLLIAVVAIILERMMTRYLSRFARRARLAPNVANSLSLTFRLLILIGAVASVVKVGWLPTEWFVTFSALGGAAVGFASTKTIGNFVAGLYLLATRPYRVGDYVRFGAVEGIVTEMTINYTKIQTIGNNIVSISNLQIMDRDITNYLYESDRHDGLYCYTFEIGFDHSVPTARIEGVFTEALRQYEGKFQRAPSYMLARSDAFGRVYVVYLYVKDPREIFTYRPEIAREVFRRWDKQRNGHKR